MSREPSQNKQRQNDPSQTNNPEVLSSAEIMEKAILDSANDQSVFGIEQTNSQAGEIYSQRPITSPNNQKSLPKLENTWYGTKRYEIVEHVLDQLELKKEKDKILPVQLAIERASAPFKAKSIEEIVKDYDGPSKYLNQRDAPLAIPSDVIKKLFDAMDYNINNRVTLDELQEYIQEKRVPIQDHIAEQMFQDIINLRIVVHKEQKQLGFSLDELTYAIKGRHSWDTEEKKWKVTYRQYRDYWVLLLLTISPNVFILQYPKIIPPKISTQYEVQSEFQKTQNKSLTKNLNNSKSTTVIKEQRVPQFQRDLDKPEGGVQLDPQGGLFFGQDFQDKLRQDHPFEKRINGKLTQDPSSSFNKFTFENQELYQQALGFCQQKPYWKNDNDHPIFKYVTDKEQTFKPSNIDFNEDKKTPADIRRDRILSLNDHSGKAPLQLAATMALLNRTNSPQSQIRARKGFVTASRVPDVFEDKATQAQQMLTIMNRTTGERKHKPNEYADPKNPKFREEFEVIGDMKDFQLRIMPQKVDNPHGLSVFQTIPRYQFEKQKEAFEKQEALRKFQEAKKPHDWIKYHKMPEIHTEISANFKDKHNKLITKVESSPFLQKEEWKPYKVSTRDDFEHSAQKPKLDLYYNGLKAEHKNFELGGINKPFKVIT